MKQKNYLLLVLLFCLSSCATIVGGGGSQNITFTANNSSYKPKAAILTAKGNTEANLPVTMKVKRSSKDVIVQINEDDCYQGLTQSVPSNINLWFLGNLVTGGFIGTTTDAATGALWRYDDTAIIYAHQKETCVKE